MEISDKNLLNYIQKEINKTNPELDTSTITYETDLSNIGIESIVLISLLSQIEKEFKINISLESLEKNNFVISAKSISGSLVNDRS